MEVPVTSRERARTHCLTPLARKPFKDKAFAVLDIECGKPGDRNPLVGRFVIAQVRLSSDPDTTYNFTDIGKLLDFLTSKRCRGLTVYSLNGAGYDYIYLMQYIRQHSKLYHERGIHIDYMMRGDGRAIAITLRMNRDKVVLADFYHIAQMSLDKLTSYFAPEYRKQERDWKIRDENGKWTGKWNWFNPNSPVDMSYLDTDTLGLLYAIKQFRRVLYDTFGIMPKLTAASTAMAAWRTSLPEDAYYWRQRPDVEMFCRQGYAGGYVFLTSINKQSNMVHVDAHAMYGTQMKQHGVPVGTAAYTTQWVEGLPGYYRCIVNVPDSERYPIIPFKGERGETLWATGTGEAILPSCTIEYAKSLGYTFTVLDGYVFEDLSHIFDSFIGMCESLEATHRGTAIAQIAKLMRNSLYGKFAMNPLGEKIIWLEEGDDEPDKFTPLIDEQTGEALPWLGSVPEIIQAPYMQVHWAAWITAEARIDLHRVASEGQAVYGDTDSVVLTPDKLDELVERGVIELGDQYGDWAVEHNYEWFIAHAAKDYIGKETGGKVVNKAKAIPRDQVDTDAHLAAGSGTVAPVEYDSVKSLKAILKDPRDIGTHRTRSYSSIANSRQWVVDEFGEVRPRRLDIGHDMCHNRVVVNETTDNTVKGPTRSNTSG